MLPHIWSPKGLNYSTERTSKALWCSNATFFLLPLFHRVSADSSDADVRDRWGSFHRSRASPGLAKPTTHLLSSPSQLPRMGRREWESGMGIWDLPPVHWTWRPAPPQGAWVMLAPWSEGQSCYHFAADTWFLGDRYFGNSKRWMKSPVHLSSLGPWLNSVLFLEWLRSAKRGHDIVKSAKWINDFLKNETNSRKSPLLWRPGQCLAEHRQNNPKGFGVQVGTAHMPFYSLVQCFLWPTAKQTAQPCQSLPQQMPPSLRATRHSLYITCSCLPAHFVVIPLVWTTFSFLPPDLFLILYSSIVISPSLPSPSRINNICDKQLRISTHSSSCHLLSFLGVCLPVRLW